MKNIKIITFIVLYFLVSCSIFKKNEQKKYFEFNSKQRKIKVVEFEKTNEFEIPYDTIIKYELIESDDSSFIISGLKVRSNDIFTYKINKKTKDVKRKIIHFNYKLSPIEDFGYLNKDSVFVMYAPAYNDFYHDSILFLINDNGKIKKSFSFDNAPVLCKNNPEYENNDAAVYLNSNIYEHFNYINNKIFLMFASKTQVLGDFAYSNLPMAGYINSKNNNFQPININFPDIKYGQTYFPGAFKRFFATLSSPNNILYSFKYTPTILQYNYKTKEIIKRQIKSSIYDTIYPSLTEKDVPKEYDFEFSYPEYMNLVYDKYRNFYYRFIFSPIEYNRTVSLLIADSSFNVIAEGFPPTNSFNLFITKDYIITIGSNTRKPSQGNIIFTCYKLKFRDGTNQELISKIKVNKKNIELINKPITHYLKKNKKIKDKNSTTTIMYYEMCPKIREFVLGFYQFNKTKFEKANVNLVLVTENVQSLKNDLKKFNLLPENNSNIFIDSTYTFASYNGNKRNDLPRIVTVRNNKIDTDTIFNNDDGKFHENFMNFLIRSGKEQEALKKQ